MERKSMSINQEKDFVYCPICGKEVPSELGKQSPEQLEGLWQCGICDYQFVLSHIKLVK
jgi:ribosomal protein L37AE/L43A